MGRGKKRHLGRLVVQPGSPVRGRYATLTQGAEAGDTAERECARHGWSLHVLYGSDIHGKRWHCKQCDVARVTERRVRHKKMLVAEAGGQCLSCGYNKYSGALQFHHRDPAAKLFAISGEALNKSIDALRVEAKKCDLLCGNCHAKVEYELAIARVAQNRTAPLIEEDGKSYSECSQHGRTEFIQTASMPRLRCKRCRNEAVLKTMRKHKDCLINEFGGKCQECEYADYRGALEFHHRDPETKSFSLSNVGSISYARLLAEAQKCDLLCSNCHAEHHAGELESEDVTAAAAA